MAILSSPFSISIPVSNKTPFVSQSFEQLNQRAVAVVIDPIQSVKGKVVIDAFRTINPQLMLLNQEPRQTTSNIGHLNKPSIQALIHGLNRHYYSIVIDYRKNELEEQVRKFFLSWCGLDRRKKRDTQADNPQTHIHSPRSPYPPTHPLHTYRC